MPKEYFGKYWLHRISNEWDVSYKLMDDGYLTIGWSCLMQSNIIDCMGDTVDTRAFEKVMEEEGLKTFRSRWNLYYFFSFSPGDVVLVPLFNGEFSIFRVLEKARRISEVPGYADFKSYDGTKISRSQEGFLVREDRTIVDIGFSVRVEPLKERISRYKYADNRLTSRMKIRQTNADITDIAESVQTVLTADEPINLYSSIIEDLAEKMLETIKNQLSPEKFELLVKWYFEKIGSTKAFCPAKNESGKNDGADADVIAEFDPLKIVFYIQVKLHDETTSQWAVDQISRYKDQHEITTGEFTSIPWVITSADRFTNEAVAMAQDNIVRLITGIEFSRMLIDAGIIDINAAFD